MSTPRAFITARAPQLAGLSWAIGGSTLLQQLGLVDEPRDLDLITTAEDFAAVKALLLQHASDITPPPHPLYATRHFARLQTADGLEIDLIAGLAIRLDKGQFRWPFDASAVWQADGLNWCMAEDWALLYRLMGYSEQTEALDEWLDEHGVSHPQRIAANLFAGYPEKYLKPAPDWWPWEE